MHLIYSPIQKSLINPLSRAISSAFCVFLAVRTVFKKQSTRCKPESRKQLPSDPTLFRKKKLHFRSWHWLVHLNSTADQHLGLILHAPTSLSMLYIQKQLHWLAGSAKKRKNLKKDPALTTISSRKRRTLPLAKHMWGQPAEPCQGLSRTKLHKIF